MISIFSDLSDDSDVDAENSVYKYIKIKRRPPGRNYATAEEYDALKYIFKNKQDLESINILYKTKKFQFINILRNLTLMTEFPPQKDLIERINNTVNVDFSKINAQTKHVENSFTCISINKLYDNTEEKFRYMKHLLESNGKLVTELDPWPFKITFNDVSQKLLMGLFQEELVKILANLDDFLGKLMKASDNISQLQSHSERLSAVPHLVKMLVYDEQRYLVAKLTRIIKALQLTEYAKLEERKQKLICVLKYVLLEHNNKYRFDDIPDNLTKNQSDDLKTKYKNRVKEFKTRVDNLRKQHKEAEEELLEIIAECSEILKRQRLYETRKKEVDCVDVVLGILEMQRQSPKLKECLINARRHAEENLRPGIISTWAELYDAIEDLERDMKNYEDENGGKKDLTIGIEKSPDRNWLERMKNKFADKLQVKKATKFMDGDENKIPIYKLKSNVRGICLILNNIEFTTNVKKKRYGANIDDKNLENIFEQCNFRVIAKRNCKKAEIIYSLQNIQPADCLIVIIMSHGNYQSAVEQSYFISSDEQPIKVSEILELFTYEKCHQFHNKPKIFMFQTCRGGQLNAVFKKEDDQANISLEENVPNVNDTLLAFSTLPGYKSKRNTKLGAVYISEFCDVFRKNACDTHLEDMLKMVNNNLKGRRMFDDAMQTSSFENRGFNHCYFNPGITE